MRNLIFDHIADEGHVALQVFYWAWNSTFTVGAASPHEEDKDSPQVANVDLTLEQCKELATALNQALAHVQAMAVSPRTPSANPSYSPAPRQ